MPQGRRCRLIQPIANSAVFPDLDSAAALRDHHHDSRLVNIMSDVQDTIPLDSPLPTRLNTGQSCS
jgi:hypothetical protein